MVILAGVAVAAVLLDKPLPAVDGRARASDGDSFRLGDDRIRLTGLDAPELSQHCRGPDGDWPCGAVARDRMAALLEAGTVHCQPEGRDRYDRLLARCAVADRDLGAIMVAEGLAVSDGGYWREEAQAKQQGLGIWVGTFDRPSDWRTDHARPASLLDWLW